MPSLTLAPYFVSFYLNPFTQTSVISGKLIVRTPPEVILLLIKHNTVFKLPPTYHCLLFNTFSHSLSTFNGHSEPTTSYGNWLRFRSSLVYYKSQIHCVYMSMSCNIYYFLLSQQTQDDTRLRVYSLRVVLWANCFCQHANRLTTKMLACYYSCSFLELAK